MPRVIAHRGASAEAPENTLAACELALRQGADGIEVDVRPTRDGRLAILHDAAVDRTTDGRGHLRRLTLERVQRLDAGGGHRVPMLRDVVELVGERAELFVEIKSSTRLRSIDIAAAALDELARARVPPERFRLLAFELATLAAVRRARPDARLMWNLPLRLARPSCLERVRGLACAVGVPDRAATPALLARAGQLDLERIPFTVDDEARAAALVADGADAVITNRPAAVRAALTVAADDEESAA